MTKILSKILSVLKIVLMFGAFGIILVGLLLTNKRLEKGLLDSLSTFIPFGLILIMTMINLFSKKAKMSENLLFNFTSCILFGTIIFIGYRAKFDTNMLLYYKYQIGYNPTYLSDNLSSMQVIIYCLIASNAFFLIRGMITENDVILPKTAIVENKPVEINNVSNNITPIVQQTNSNVEEL